MSRRILIAGIGNVFFGDDGFGVEVVRQLAQRPLPEGVRVVDFGIRGIDLTYALLDDYEAVIFVDAVMRGGQPGTLYVLEPEPQGSDPEAPGALEPHSLEPHKVLRLAQTLGSTIPRVVLVGCDVSPPPGEDDLLMELSEPVRAAVEEAVRLVTSLISRLQTVEDGKLLADR